MVTTTTASAPQTRYQVADLLVDTAQRRVSRDGSPIEVSALNFDLLRILIESAPNVVTYDDLAERVWERHFVSPENVAQRVKLLRQSLSDDASEPRYVATVRGKGYRLIPSVQAVFDPLTPVAGPRRRPLTAIAATLAAAVLLAAGGGIYWRGTRPAEIRDTAARLPNSVAILPFENLSPDPDDAYFAAGIHQEVIGQLAKVPNLSVIAQTSVQRYANGEKSIREIATELNVEYVIEGSVRYAGERVRITPNLIDAATGASRWSEVYDRQLGDVFAIQEDIAINIAMAMGEAFPPLHRASTRGQGTTSPEAAALYLRVLNLQRQVSYDAVTQLQYLDSALAFDPNFANAYAQKAGLYAISVVDRADGRALDTDPRALEALALENATRALELDPTSTQAYLATGLVRRNFWRWKDAISAYEEAYELSPNDVDVLCSLGETLSLAGHHERAIRLLERAAQIDPLSPISRLFLGVAFAQAGRAATAAAVLREAVSVMPTAVPIRHWLAQMEAASGNPAQALLHLQAVERLVADSWTNPTIPTGLLYSYSRIGRTEDVARLLDVVKQMAATGPIGPSTWALTHLALGDTDEAYRWLTVAVERVEKHDPDPGFLNLMTIKTNPHANPVLEEPRFRELRDRIGTLD